MNMAWKPTAQHFPVTYSRPVPTRFREVLHRYGFEGCCTGTFSRGAAQVLFLGVLYWYVFERCCTGTC